MRSRDGDNTSSFRIAKIVFMFFSFALSADEYLISYSYSVKNSIIYNEKLFVSHSMTSCKKKPFMKPLLLENKNNNLTKTIKANQEKFTDYLTKIGIEVKNKSQNIALTNSSFTTVTFKTRCFKVDFNDNFVKIQPLK